MAHNHEKVYGICENKCFVEVLSKKEIALLTYQELTSDTEFYVLNGDDEELYSKFVDGFLLINKSDQDIDIKLLDFVEGTDGQQVKIKCNLNGEEKEEITTTVGTFGSDPFYTTKFDFTFFTLAAGKMATFKFISCEKV